MATPHTGTTAAPAKAGSARRAELLTMAAPLFATKGFRQTTVRDIADEAGILSGSLYHHFSSKEDMLIEVLSEFLGGLQKRFEGIVEAGGTPREVLDGLVRESFATIAEQRDTVALYQNEQGFLTSTPGFEFVGESSRENERIWIGVLRAGRESGAFRHDLDLDLTYRFIRDAVWASVHWYRPGGRFGHETIAEQYLALLHDGLAPRRD